MTINIHIHDHRDNGHKLELILEQLSHIHKQNTTIMATIQDVQDALTALQASVDAKQQAIADAIKALEDQIAAGSAATPEQLQGIVDGLKAVQADVDSTATA